ncbi:MAG: ion channel [Pseudomonadota bacterium]|jgi:apolipoprotein N-acyltransferase|uniref:ion channel n=1 Tax=Pseudooceanicola nitratireducens TaxID=517719 RepID=UPI002EB7C2E0|nr:ion channel [Pseudomonadota bacterium]
MTLFALAIGTTLIVVAGLLHHGALYNIGRFTQASERNSTRTIHLTFAGLLVLHVGEILAFSAVNFLLLNWDSIGGPKEEAIDWADVIYLTGVNFTTLGYTQIELVGPIRMVTMLQSLGGFMLLTWSATYLFTVCQKSWQQAERE